MTKRHAEKRSALGSRSATRSEADRFAFGAASAGGSDLAPDEATLLRAVANSLYIPWPDAQRLSVAEVKEAIHHEHISRSSRRSR